MKRAHDTAPIATHWEDFGGREAMTARLIAALAVPMRNRPGIDGDATAACVAADVFDRCRLDSQLPACVLLAEWLHEAALASVREYGRENEARVWERAGPST